MPDRTSVYSITVDEAREYEQSRGSVASASATSTTNAPVEVDEETRILTFAELKELIESGKVDQIPNNKVIPEAINEAPPSQSTVGVRKKPWELADSQS
ncbi:hypothetical protein NLJ89_g6338 [Agrocybe chaxingu]|uniref:Peroxisomal membrane protein PEX14-like KPWE domain-containing protein n=1 Tax=Agrocybe chaxingu TaxID=84603 RepID=A0A9W8JYT9_9AGAR|nr:hypothetical protein NLJ89_g6338 [Agrocybe chaxingu]